MISDGVIALRPLEAGELELAHAMSRTGDTSGFIVAYSLQRHRREHASPGIVYLSIVETVPDPVRDGAAMAGYFILARDPDGESVECRRIVVARKNRGIGKRAMRLLDRYCREELGAARIWLDVYDFNTRGQRVYESCGYRFVGDGYQDGKRLLFYEKRL